MVSTAKSITCPRCSAPGGAPCIDMRKAGQNRRKGLHSERQAAWREMPAAR